MRKIFSLISYSKLIAIRNLGIISTIGNFIVGAYFIVYLFLMAGLGNIFWITWGLVSVFVLLVFMGLLTILADDAVNDVIVNKAISQMQASFEKANLAGKLYTVQDVHKDFAELKKYEIRTLINKLSDIQKQHDDLRVSLIGKLTELESAIEMLDLAKMKKAQRSKLKLLRSRLLRLISYLKNDSTCCRIVERRLNVQLPTALKVIKAMKKTFRRPATCKKSWEFIRNFSKDVKEICKDLEDNFELDLEAELRAVEIIAGHHELKLPVRVK